MKERIKIPVATSFLFILLLIFSGSLSDPLGEILYYLAFIIPIGIGLYTIRKQETSGSEKQAAIGIKLSTGGALTALPMILPIIGATALVSFLTSELMGAFGITNEQSFEEPFMLALLLHALIPAVLEEMLFRYVPLKLLSANRRCAVTVSAILFAFSHASLFQIPYALLAGALFAVLCYTTGSIIPSLAVHFLNNTLSLILIYGYGGLWLYITLCVLLVASICAIAIKRKRYAELISSALAGKTVFSYELILFISITALLALTNLFA